MTSQPTDPLSCLSLDVPAADDSLSAGCGDPLSILADSQVEDLTGVTLEVPSLDRPPSGRSCCLSLSLHLLLLLLGRPGEARPVGEQLTGLERVL